MTLTDDDLRAALDHRLRAAGLDGDDPAIPEPSCSELRLVASDRRPPRARRLASVAAALLLVAGAAALVAIRRDGAIGTEAGTTTSTASVTTTAPTDERPELPPPWPALDVRPQTRLDLHGDPIDSEQEFVDRLSELDQQSQDEAASGRMNVLDQLTGEIVNVDAHDYQAQWFEVIHWYQDHIGMPPEAAITDLDPTIVFTDGSFRLIYRSDLGCTPDADGLEHPACLVPGRDDGGDRGGPAPDPVERGN